jgi:site-specific recombinase XerD
MSVYRRGDSFWFEFQVHGVRYRGPIGKVSRRVAREVAEKKRIAALEGKLVERPVKSPVFGQYDATTRRFSGAVREYLDYYKQNHKTRSAGRAEYAMIPLCAAFNAKRLDQISPFQIESYKMQRKSEDFADATVNRELACLKNFFSMAITWGWTRDNPVRQVKLFRENNARLRWLSLEEEDALLEHCDQRLRTFVTAAVDTGFRANELRSLQWQDVDFKQGNITVHSGYTKNGEPRTNPMTPRLEQTLIEWKNATNGGNQDRVFGAYGYRSPFERAKKLANLGQDVVFHSLRHTYISRLTMGGVDIRTVQELAGHKTITMTMRYAHLAPEHKRRAIAVLDREVPTFSPTQPMVVERKLLMAR